MSTKEILDQALRLPLDERAAVARELLVSLEEDGDEGAAAAWLAEVRRRLDEVEAGSVPLEPWLSHTTTNWPPEPLATAGERCWRLV